MNNNTSYIDEIELNNYIQKLNYYNDSIRSNLNDIYNKSLKVIDGYNTHNTNKLSSMIEIEESNIDNINTNNEKYMKTIMLTISKYKDIAEEVSSKFKQG